jgi:Na+/H+ antiporter NhaD/arsenite permease-like protein
VLFSSALYVNLKREAIILVDKIQDSIKSEQRKGFWYVSLASFVLSPLLTNDGVCLLMVEPVLAAFHPPEKMDTEHKLQVKNPSKARANGSMELSSADALYFMLTICSSANIGSALTYTGTSANSFIFDFSNINSPFIPFQATNINVIL